MNLKHALSVRSDFSLVESMFQVGDIVDKAKALGYESVALTDTMSISSMVRLASKAKKAGIRPIVGAVIRVVDDPLYRKPKTGSGEIEHPNPGFNLKVYPINDLGLRSLMRLISRGLQPDYFYYVSRVGMQDVLQLTDCVVTTGDLFNLFHHPKHVEILKELYVSMAATYVEIVSLNTPLFDTLNIKALAAAKLIGVPVVATTPVFYGESDDADSLDVLRAISMNTEVTSRFLPIPYNRDWYLKPPQQLAIDILALKHRLVADPRAAGFDPKMLISALENVDAVAVQCKYVFEKLKPSLPVMATDEFATMVALCVAGWKQRFAGEVLGHKPTDLTPYKERLKYELGVLKNMGFAGYFLLVTDIVNFAKSNHIMVGPGRGSVGGSLVAYLLGITDVDPIRFDLLFERFINPDRIDLPDADLDFMASRRGEVIEYACQKYGAECVAGIANYTTLGAAGAIRDVSRVHELNALDYSVSKQVVREHGVPLSLEESASQVPDIERFANRHPGVWKHALKLEGAMRGMSQHAAGIVVAGEPVANRAILNCREEGVPVINWDKDAVEDWGLIKMDILGLTTLDVITKALAYIEARHKRKVNLLKLHLDEPDVMKAFGKGDTTGVFQFESPGMRKLLREMAESGILTFDDLVAVVALYRPGPLDAGLVEDYTQIRAGKKKPYYESDNMEPALRKTFGVIVYQEQVMQIARDVAGFTMVQADHLRKAMGKKDKDKMAEMRDKFVAGCVAHSGMDERIAGQLWDKIEVFAGYAFNKSHSVEYAIISVWTMWLKVRYAAEFFAGAMSIVDDDEKLAALVMDANKSDIMIMPPDINLSSMQIEIADDRTLYAPFQAIKGISTNVADKIVQTRNEKGAFTSKEDFEAKLKEVVGGKVNIAHRGKLELVGALAAVMPGSLHPKHPERLKDQLELMPGFSVEMVKADRVLVCSDPGAGPIAKAKIVGMFATMSTCKDCTLSGGVHPLPRMGSKAKFMMVFDCPSYQEDKKRTLIEGDVGDFIKAAMKEQNLSLRDGYFTTLVKSMKDGKMLTNEQINGCSKYLAQEIEILKPAVIVAMGSNAIRYFAPTLKGPANEMIGKAIFRSDLDATIVFGFNPAQVIFDGSKVGLLQDVMRKLQELVG